MTRRHLTKFISAAAQASLAAVITKSSNESLASASQTSSDTRLINPNLAAAKARIEQYYERVIKISQDNPPVGINAANGHWVQSTVNDV